VTLIAQALDLPERERSALVAATEPRHQTARVQVDVKQWTTPLVGREREQMLLTRLLEEGKPPVIFLAGEPGIGKTRLLRESTRRAALAGMTVLAGGCERRGGQE